jgi:hypothetical protein
VCCLLGRPLCVPMCVPMYVPMCVPMCVVYLDGLFGPDVNLPEL